MHKLDVRLFVSMKKFYLEISFFVMLMLFSNSATMGQAVVKLVQILIEKHVEKLKIDLLGWL